ncbi:MAG: hypothetical protein P4L33_03220 [Capsulimonadaceae bacterium]|nr:hypothetical protein [Capsulimonadaceae bacterium]
MQTEQLPSRTASSKHERTFVWSLIAITILLSVVPDMYGWAHSSPGRRYVGFSYNVADSSVYMAWAQQVIDGRLLTHNPFTNTPQPGCQFNLFTVLIGCVSRISHIPIPLAFLVARAGFGIALLWLLHRFTLWAIPGSFPARMTSFAPALARSGIGVAL